MSKQQWQSMAEAMANEGSMSWRQIAKALGISKSTVSDYLRGCKIKEPSKHSNRHLLIPDCQVKQGIDMSFLTHIGKYIVKARPDVIINIGDFADMPSLSSYDKGKRAAEGRRVCEDIAAAKEGMKLLLAPMRELQEQQRAAGKPVYSPRMVLTLGNHEARIDRHVDANPELHGFLGMHSLGYEEAGWEVYPFLTPVIVNGVAYCHFFQNVLTGKPLSGTAANMLKTIGQSFTQGHRQVLDVATRFLPADGSQQWGLIAGACYTHEEEYKGAQGNAHWRGVVLKHNVRNGSYDPLFVGLDWLAKTYEGEQQ